MISGGVTSIFRYLLFAIVPWCNPDVPRRNPDVPWRDPGVPWRSPDVLGSARFVGNRFTQNPGQP